MRILLIVLTVFVSLAVRSQQSIPPIGLWREHLPYNSAIAVAAADNKVYCATPYSLFVVDETKKSIERMSRITGLSETGISTINYDAAEQKLFIAYSNSNIDILYRNDIINIPDIKRDNIPGDKNIYRISAIGSNYYLSTGLGVIIIDGERYEVKDSWFIGDGGAQLKVNGFASDGIRYYAATEAGLKICAAGVNPVNYSNWITVGSADGLAPGPVSNVVLLQGKMLAEKNDSIFIQNGNSWSLLYADGWPIINSTVSADRLLLSQRRNEAGRVQVLDITGTVNRTIAQLAPVSFPRQAIIHNNDTWIADQFGGLSHHTGSTYEQYKPNSPEATASGQMLVYNNIFYATAGAVNDAWNYQFNSNGIFTLRDGSWENINRFRFPVIDSLLDYITITIDPRDETIWAGSFGGGLLQVKPGPLFQIYKQQFLGAAIGDPGSYRVGGLAFDGDRNLWIANYGAAQPLRVRKADGSWAAITIPFFLNENATAQILVDDNNYVWIVSPKGNGLIVYDPGTSIDNMADDRWRLYRGGAGNGNLPGAEVQCIAKDKNGFIWVGTADGIGVLQCTQDVFTAVGCEAVWPIVQQGSFNNYLFKGVEVRDIAVDGADRKWVATATGVWLVSANGEKVIFQFTETNSPLLSSDVKKITIDGTTGEVFFATLKGICSFRSTATEGTETNTNVLVFPNPVPPNYTGTIGIRGLVNNAIVKITELDGRLVYQTRALGGQATWDGRDYQGRKKSAGVYLVLVSDDSRKEKMVTKIVFVR